MNKIWLVIKREYWVRVRKKSFIIMTLLGPVLSVLPIALTVYFSTKDVENKQIEVLDESGLFNYKNKKDKSLSFTRSRAATIEQAKDEFRVNKNFGLLYIPKINLDKPEGITFLTRKSSTPEMEGKLKDIIKSSIEDEKMMKAGINKEVLDKIKTDFNIKSININNEYETNAWGTWIVGYGLALMLYISLFIYGVQVMRGVIEEKTSRIVEVMISSVKPIQLMMGKIIGIGLVGLTQFTLWILIGWFLSSATLGLTSKSQLDEGNYRRQIRCKWIHQHTQFETGPAKELKSQSPVGDFIQTLNLPLIIGCFIFYFLGGYLLYSALFAAVGSAVDAETDTQQFMLPITIPIIISFIAAQYVLREPDGPIAFWMSIIPFTSPIIMMVRLPFIDASQYWQIALSMALLVIGFVGTSWLAARIYRVGILMYGKKVSYKELYKWLFYKL